MTIPPDDRPVRVALRPPHAMDGLHAAELRTFLERVEDSALDGVFSGDHVSFHDGTGFDGLVHATAMAVASDRLLVWNAVYLLALRHPVTVARQVSSLAALAPGRFQFGVGLGGEDPHELAVCGVDPRTRGRRLDLHLDIVRDLLTGRTVDVDDPALGIRIPGAVVRPIPVPRVPILIGGRSDAALRRVGRAGDGWVSVWITPERARSSVDAIGDHAASFGRADVSMRHSMLLWCGLGRTATSARRAVSEAMERLYKIPFQRFERYTPYGGPTEIVDAIRPFVDAGISDILLNPVTDGAVDLVEQADEIARLLGAPR